MKPYFFKSLFLLCFSLLLGCRSDSVLGELGQEFKPEIQTLKNGLKLILVEDHSIPVISYQTWVRAGSVDESPGKTGIAHLFEHLMFKGTQKFPPRSFFTRLEMKGAYVNAQASRDYTVFYQTFSPHLLDEVIALDSDRLKNFSLTLEELEMEKRVVFEEKLLQRAEGGPNPLQEALWNLAYRVHPYGSPISGYFDDVMKLTPDEVQSFFQTYYVASNLSIVIVGNFKTKEVLKKISEAYQGLPKKPVPKRNIPSEPKVEEERRWLIKDSVPLRQLGVGYRIPSAQKEDSFALDVMANILFEGKRSRAHYRLVEKEALFTQIQGIAYTPTYSGLFSIQASLAPPTSFELAEKQLFQLIQEIQTTPVTPREVHRAVGQLTRDLIDHANSAQGLAYLLGTIQVILGDLSKVQETWDQYFKVSPADVKRVAQEYFDPNNRVVIHVLPEDPQERKK